MLVSRILKQAVNSSTFSATASKSAVPLPLTKNVKFDDILKPRWHLECPNYLRIPLWKNYFESQFCNGNFFIFGGSWTTVVSITALLLWSRLLDPPPMERLDRYWINSPKFRILSAYHNPGKRPGLRISELTYSIRYYFKQNDHPFNLNEYKDIFFKLRENYFIALHKGIQYPYVFRQFNRVQTPAELKVHVYPAIQASPAGQHENH